MVSVKNNIAKRILIFIKDPGLSNTDRETKPYCGEATLFEKQPHPRFAQKAKSIAETLGILYF